MTTEPLSSSTVDTGPVDTGPVDTGAVDTGTVDSGAVDRSSPSSTGSGATATATPTAPATDPTAAQDEYTTSAPAASPYSTAGGGSDANDPAAIGPPVAAGNVQVSGSYDAAASTTAAAVEPPEIAGKNVGTWSEHGLWTDRAALVAGSRIPSPLGANGFDSVDEASAWAAAAVADRGAEGAVIVEHQGRFFAYEIDAKTWVDGFNRSQLEGGTDRLSLDRSEVAGVRAYVTADGYVASPTGVAGNPQGLPTEIVTRDRADADSWSTRVPPLAAYSDLIEARQAGRDLGLGEAGNEALFTGVIRSQTLAVLDTNEARLDGIQAQYAAAVDDPSSELFSRLRDGLRADQALAERQKFLEGEIWGLRQIMTPVGPGGMPVMLPTGTLEGYRSELAALQKGLDSVVQARVVLRDAIPALAVVDSGEVSAELSNDKLFEAISKGYDEVRGHIADAREGIHTGDMPLEELSPIVRHAMSQLGISEESAAAGDTLSKDALEWLDWENSKDSAYSWTGRVLAAGLGIGAIVATWGGATPAVVTALAVGGTAAGAASSVYDFERSGDLFTAAGASEGGGRNLLDSPEAAKFARTMAYVDLALTAFDIGIAAKAGSPLLKGLLRSPAAAEAVLDGTFPVLGKAQWKALDDIVSLRIAGNTDEAAQALSSLRQNLDPADFAQVERLVDSYTEASRAKLAMESFDPWTDYIAPKGTMPLGFESVEQYQRFGADLYSSSSKAGYDDVTALFQGSSVTGVKFTNNVPFDVGRISDYDIALASPKLMERARELGIPLRTGGTRTAPLTATQLKQLGLGDLARTLSSSSQRQVNFMIFESVDGATAKTASVIVSK